jgi:hypothetical protein
MMKSFDIYVWMVTQYHHQTDSQVEHKIHILKQLMRNLCNKRQNNWSCTLPAIAAAMHGTPHESLDMSPYHELYGHPWKIFPHVQKAASKVPAVGEVLNTHGATTIVEDMARKHASFCQTVQADTHRKPLLQPFKNGTRVRVRGRRYTSSHGRSKKVEPHWFGLIKVLEDQAGTEHYKLQLAPRMARQKPYCPVKESRENDDVDSSPAGLTKRPLSLLTMQENGRHKMYSITTTTTTDMKPLFTGKAMQRETTCRNL